MHGATQCGHFFGHRPWLVQEQCPSQQWGDAGIAATLPFLHGDKKAFTGLSAPGIFLTP